MQPKIARHHGGLSRPVTIIGSFVSPYVRKVLACLNLKGIGFEVDPITPFFGDDEFERLSPLRRIPVMIADDLEISDSSVICAYLEEAYGGHSLLPIAPRDRARARWLEEFADTRLGDLLIWSLFYQRVVRPLVWGEPTDESRVQSALSEGIPAALRYLEKQLPADGFLYGEIGIADIAIATFFRNGAYAGYAIDADTWPRTAGLVSRTLNHACVAKLLPFEDVQRSANIKGRRQALLDAGAPLTERSWAVRDPQRGVMAL